MALPQFIHVILLIIEDILVWLGGKAGIPVWIIIIISIIALIYFWNPITNILKRGLIRLGVG